MRDAQSLLGVMGKAALMAMEEAGPAGIFFGTVESVEPLLINVEQKLTLSEKQLILTRHVTDYVIEMTVAHTTEEHSHTHVITDTWMGGGSASVETHLHDYVGRKEFLVHNALRPGETVVLLQIQGGQRYLVVDRV